MQTALTFMRRAVGRGDLTVILKRMSVRAQGRVGGAFSLRAYETKIVATSRKNDAFQRRARRT